MLNEAKFEIIEGYRPLFVDGGKLYAAKGLSLYLSEDNAESFSLLAEYRASIIDLKLAEHNFSSRVLRAGFHTILPRADGSIIAVLRKTIAYKPADSDRFEKVLQIKRGSRPLNISESQSGKLFFGEYFQNNDRQEIHVYGSDNGKDWQIVYSFAAGEIRHVHGIYYDPYRKGMWLLSGDDNEESALWFSDDDFATLKPIVRGTQQARAVAIVPLKDGLLVPMDTPREKNYIQHFSFTSGFKKLFELPGSAFHIIDANGVFFLSTVAEESKVNKASGASVFAASDIENWQEINHFEQEMKVPKIVARVIRYPDIILTPGKYGGEFGFARAQAVKNYDGKMIRWSLNEVKHCLQNRD